MLYFSINIYFIICIILLLIGSFFTIKALIKYTIHFKKSNFLIRAFITPLIPDIVCIINFFLRDLYNLFIGRLDTSIWCEISATFSVAHFLSLFGGLFFIAFCTYKMSLGKIVSNKIIIFYNILIWLFGFVYAIYLQQLNILGEFKGLYCCIHEESLTHPSVIFISYIAIVIVSATIGYYILAYRTIKKQKQYTRIRNRVKEVILYRGFMFFISFFSCWSLMLYKVILHSFHLPELNLFLEMLASWTVKCMPIVNSLILLRLFNIIEKKEEIRNNAQQELSNFSGSISV